MYLFSLLSLSVLWGQAGFQHWGASCLSFLPQHMNCPNLQVTKAGYMSFTSPLIFDPASQGGLWTLRDQEAGNPSAPWKATVEDDAVSCSILCEEISPPELLDGMGRAFLPAAPKDGMGWTWPWGFETRENKWQNFHTLAAGGCETIKSTFHKNKRRNKWMLSIFIWK